MEEKTIVIQNGIKVTLVGELEDSDLFIMKILLEVHKKVNNGTKIKT